MVAQNKTLNDSISIAICCDDGSCLCVSESSTISLPNTRILTNSSWRDQCSKDFKELCGLDLATPMSVYRIYKIWLPSGFPAAYVMHCIFVIYINSEFKKKMRSATGKFSGRVKWCNESELARLYQQEVLNYPVLLELYPKLVSEKQGDFRLNPIDVSITGLLIEITEKTFFETVSNNFETTVDASGLRPLQATIYREFLNAAYPNYLLSPVNFAKFMMELGLSKDDAVYSFRAADFNNRKFLSFRDLMCLLAVLEPSTNHGGVTGEIRCRYIFRFFDRDRDNCLNYNELKDMLIYIRKLKGLPVDASSVDKEHKSYAASLSVTPTKAISLVDFLKAAGELKIRGLSQILRLPKSLKTMMAAMSPPESKSPGGKVITLDTQTKTRVDSVTIAKIEFEIAVHTVRVSKSGTNINVEDIWSVKDCASPTCIQQANITRDMRRASCDIHSQDSLYNELIKNLRYLATLNKCRSGNRGNRKEQYMWGFITPNTYAVKLTQVCNNLKAVLKNEPRLLELHSPLYIMGDFHGNYGDLQYFERMFWPIGPGFCPCNLLFLGDYVDRGPFGIEVVTYLFCYKALFPNKIHLVRGNHEIREIQKTFTFYSECLAKFGDKIGNEIWETINITFDHMPIAAVVDGKLFCCHGGVPPPWLCPIATAINNIPVPLSEPDTQSSLAWEILWNDPVRDKQITPELDIELKVNEGFAMNVKRGTAHVFNSDGLDRFLNLNGFTHVIRAHEMAMSGYMVMLKGKLITIFSSSKYSGQNNEAACILVENGKLRMMRLDPNA